MTGAACNIYRVILGTRASPARSSLHSLSLRDLALFLWRKQLPRECQSIFSKGDDNSISHPSHSSNNVTLTFLPLRGRVCVFLPLNLGGPVSTMKVTPCDCGHKGQYSFCLVCWKNCLRCPELQWQKSKTAMLSGSPCYMERTHGSILAKNLS